MRKMASLISCISATAFLQGCSVNVNKTVELPATAPTPAALSNQPLVTDIYTADASAHVWKDGRIYIYPSHDIQTDIPEDDLGSHFAMRDYRILSMDKIGGKVTDHGVALDIADVPWAGRQMWAPDAAYKNGTYYFYFPVKDKQDVFRIGVATSKNPAGPFKAEPAPMKGSFSIDPAVFKDSDGEHYMYFGGIWGGQLQKWATGTFNAKGSETDLGDPTAPALSGKVARLDSTMKQFAEAPRDVVVLDEAGKPLLAGDMDRRYFEGPWVFKRGELYYFTYSTGNTHYLVYAVSKNPYGPFTYGGRILEPVEGWTTHHSITQIDGKWYLFYHDTKISGKTHLRNVKVTELKFNADGSIQTIDPSKL
jgi:hypothetical protein